MDILDNLIYANYASSLRTNVAVANPFLPPNPNALGGNRVSTDFIDVYAPAAAPVNVGTANYEVFTFDAIDKLNFCSYADNEIFEKTILRHWHDINNQRNYDSDQIREINQVNPAGVSRYSSFQDSSNYHMIFAYLTENTRMVQIFERFIDKFLNDETFGIPDDGMVFNWVYNTEKLFFQGDSLRSLIRQNDNAIRRNAYWRMFGMDLAFGDINSTSGDSIPYHKANSTNQQFVPLFEKFLIEVWQAYTNARNTAGVNLSDIDILLKLAQDLRELLISRRGNMGNTYSNQNLSREEYYSVLITSWFTFIISTDTPIVQFLNCQSSTIGERLMKIGQKVGIKAHNKSQYLFELSSAATNVLNLIEVSGTFDDQVTMTNILQSLTPPVANPASREMNLMTDLLTLINYWEKATGHRLKNPETNIRGTVSVSQPQRTNGKLVSTS